MSPKSLTVSRQDGARRPGPTARARFAPSPAALPETLGAAVALWEELIALLEHRFGPLEHEWKPAATPFGSFCRLKQKKRALVYLLPAARSFEIVVVLGDRAVGLALESNLPLKTKLLITEARPYVEGRGIRFSPTSHADVAIVARLIDLKLHPVAAHADAAKEPAARRLAPA